MFEISVTGSFAATHQLRYPDGRREPQHRHVWRVRVTYAAPTLDELGMLVDFELVRRELTRVLAELDGKDLNQAPFLAEPNPTAENVARYLAGQMPAEYPRAVRLVRVEVQEAEGCAASWIERALA